MSRPDDDSGVPSLVALHAGDARAWQQAFALLWGAVWRAARRHLNDVGEAEDVAAQTLQETRLAAASTRSWAEIGALAVVIARRRAISRGRALAAQKRAPALGATPDEATVIDPAEQPQYAALRAMDIQAILATLPREQRELLQDYFLAGLTSEEVARKRGIPAVTVRSHVLRLLARVRENEERRRNTRTGECDSHSGTTS